MPSTPARCTNCPGIESELFWHGLPEPDRQHFSAFSFAACDEVHRNPEVFASSPSAADSMRNELGVESSMLMMGGAQHRRYRALVQPSFVPAKAQWWIAEVDRRDGARPHRLLRATTVGPSSTSTSARRSRCSRSPGASASTWHGPSTFGSSLRDPAGMAEILAPIVAGQRASSRPDDLISVLTEAELTDEDGTHRLTDDEIYSFAYLLMAAGSGTTWKQMGITLAALLQRPELLEAVRARPHAPACRDRGVAPLGANRSDVLPLGHRATPSCRESRSPRDRSCTSASDAANRDPAPVGTTRRVRPGPPAQAIAGLRRWRPHLPRDARRPGRDERRDIGALLDRLPNLRLDPDAEPPQLVGFYERGVMDIPVVFG